MEKLNVSNPQHMTYNHGILEIAVLGGIRLEGLDRLRVTLKICVEHLILRHNLDLYNDTQVEKLVRKTAAKLEVGTSVIAAALEELTTELENYRLITLKEQQENKIHQPKQLSAGQRQSAADFLEAPDLLERTGELIGTSGVIGEETNRLLMYLIFTSRKMSSPLHVVSLGASGTGKTHLQEKVAELVPEEDKIEVTTLSENAFYYFERTALAHKLVLIEDLDGVDSVLYPLRELQSKKRITKTISHKNKNGETATKHLIVEGPVSVAGCTTKERIYEDNANRSFLVYLDESEQQDNRIMDYQRARSAGQINETEEQASRELSKNCQRLLEPIKVVNPYAQQLVLPSTVFKPRRTNTHYLQFIEAVTFYHQAQRAKQYDKQTGEKYIETTLEDIQHANRLLKDVLLRKSDDLSGACRSYFEKLKVHLKSHPDSGFTNREMSLQLRIPITTVKRYHLELYNLGYLKIARKDKLKGYEYEIVSYEEYKQLQQEISEVLENSFNQLSATDQPSSPQAAQLQNEPPKTLNNKKKGNTAH